MGEAGEAMQPIADDAGANPLVSVIVPLHDKVAHVGTMLKSVLTQDVSSLELVCVDDCSSDGSDVVVEGAMAADSRIRLVRHTVNQGPGAARNTGLDHARGQFVAFLDADDWYGDDSYLRRLCEGALSHGVLAAGASICNVRAPGFIERHFQDNPEFAGYEFTHSGVVDYRDYQFDYGSPRFVYARDLLREHDIRFDGRSFYEDPPFMARALYAAGSFYADGHAEYLYLQEYRKPAWTTQKVLDFLEGVRLNLAFSSEHDLSKLHWVTVRHLEWESYNVPLGVDAALDAMAIDGKLRQVEAAIDPAALAQHGSVPTGFQPLLRQKLQALGDAAMLGMKARLDFALRHSKPWYALRNLRDARR